METSTKNRWVRSLAAAVAVVGLSACGNWITAVDVGQVGLTVDATGAPVVAVNLCDPDRAVITLSEGRSSSDPDDKPNTRRGLWQARKSFQGVRLFTVTDAGADWRTDQAPTTLESDRLFVIDGGTVEEKNGTLGGVSFRMADLAELSADKVRVADAVISRQKFDAYRCRGES